MTVLLMLAVLVLNVSASTRRALIFGLGKQEDTRLSVKINAGSFRGDQVKLDSG